MLTHVIMAPTLPIHGSPPSQKGSDTRSAEGACQAFASLLVTNTRAPEGKDWQPLALTLASSLAASFHAQLTWAEPVPPTNTPASLHCLHCDMRGPFWPTSKQSPGLARTQSSSAKLCCRLK
jgi:hypothetical protein